MRSCRDAPALSTDQDHLSVVTSAVFSAEIKDPLDQNSKEQESSEQWDDEAMAANTFRKNAVVVSSTPAATAGVLDMKSFDPKRTDPDNIAEKLRVEETKAQLAAAREGMERQAAKLKEERERKDQVEKSSSASSIWVAPSLRASALSRARMGTVSQKLDVQDSELFPDLAAADKILEKKEKDHAPIFKAQKKTPVGGGASWASKTSTAKLSQPSSVVEPPAVVENKSEPDEAQEPLVESETQEEIAPASKVQPAMAPAADVVVAQPVTKKTVTKKKKKDLSTFKPGS